MDEVGENGATSGAGLLADYTYDTLGRPTSLARGNGAGTSWSYVANTRNWSMTQNLSGTANDLTLGFTFSPAPQVTVRTISNTAYSFTPPTLSEAYTRDGLNRYTAVAGQAFTYDGRQNLTDDGPNTFAYDVENRLTAVSGASAMTLAYDPLGRLKQTASGVTTTRFLYDGDRLIGEYNAAGTTVTARYAHGAGFDAPLVWYEGTTLTDRRWLHADAQGSIIAVSGATGAIVGKPYSYSPYGEPDAVNGWGGSRFRYTGQISLRHAPLWHYKARIYEPALGRFLQTDPVGYVGGANLYAYVKGDPVNFADPTGLFQDPPDGAAFPLEDVVVGDDPDWWVLPPYQSMIGTGRDPNEQTWELPYRGRSCNVGAYGDTIPSVGARPRRWITARGPGAFGVTNQSVPRPEQQFQNRDRLGRFRPGSGPGRGARARGQRRGDASQIIPTYAVQVVFSHVGGHFDDRVATVLTFTMAPTAVIELPLEGGDGAWVATIGSGTPGEDETVSVEICNAP